MKKYRQTFIVEGHGPFPVDMIRYDCCYLNDTDSVIKFSDRNKRQIKLTRFLECKDTMPTFDRWNSFGWRVLKESVKTEKI